MPLNYAQVLQSVRGMGQQARQREETLVRLRQRALELLHASAGEEQLWIARVEQAAQLNPRLRCGLPASPNLRLDAVQGAPAAQPAILLAADGSQIFPDRHAAVEFAAVNSGGIRLAPGEVPREQISSQLYFRGDLDEEDMPFGEASVSLLRDLAERELLCRMAEAEAAGPLPLLALIDGSLELYTQDINSRIYRQTLPKYLAVLERLARRGAALAGYIDKAGSDHLVRLLELIDLSDLNEAGRLRSLFPVRDADLMSILLQPGERSQLLALLSPTVRNYPAHLRPLVFYLNAGRPGVPHIARVEIPAWVAADPAQVQALHAALLSQIRQMGAADPYPYLIHRAHEIAAVSFSEKEQVETMLSAELRRQGAPVGMRSAKQGAKDAGRNR